MIRGKPISPNDVAAAKAYFLPPEIFDVINELIALNFTFGGATVYLKDIQQKYNDRYGANLPAGQLNVEEAYEFMGWNVTFDKPAYNESFDSYFRFTPKRGYNANNSI